VEGETGVSAWREGGRNRERFREVEKGQAQITLELQAEEQRKGEILLLRLGVQKNIYLKMV